MIKIAFVINYITNNGPSRVVMDIMHNLDCKSYEITLITLFDGNDENLIKKLKDVGFGVHECKTLSRIKCMIGLEKEFKELIQNEHFDIVHTHGFIPDLLASHIKGKTKTISTLHNNMFEDYVTQYGFLKSLLFTKIHLRALQQIDQVVCCSESVFTVMKDYLKSITFIRNGIEIPKAISQLKRRQLNIPDDAKVYVFAGGLIPRKNISFLISEFVKNHLKNEYLIVLGDGQQKEVCKSLADDHVKMCGFQLDVISYFYISDVYVSASKSEGFSISVLEALFCGLGLFLSDIPSHREVVEMQKNFIIGELFRETNFGEKLESLRKLKLNRLDIQRFAIKSLSAANMASEYDTVYEKLCVK